MKITVHLDVETRDHTAILFDDIRDAIVMRLDGSHIHWYDPSLGRGIDADISVSEVTERSSD